MRFLILRLFPTDLTSHSLILFFFLETNKSWYD